MADDNLQAPRGFFKRGRVWHYRRAGVSRGAGRVVSTGQRDLEDAIAWVQHRPELFLYTKHKPVPIPNPFHTEPFVFTDDWITEIAYRCNGGIARSKHTFTEQILRALITRAEGHCEVTGIPFSGTPLPGVLKRPFIPSVDRVNAHLNYTYDNCRLVCFCVNAALGQWGDTVFDLMCLARCTKRLTLLGLSESSHFRPVALSA